MKVITTTRAHLSIFFLLLLSTFSTAAQAQNVRVLELSDNPFHTVEDANLYGNLSVTRVADLTGENFSNYDVLYIGEHDNNYGGREADITAAITAGQLGLVVENDAQWATISTIIGDTISSDAFDVTPYTLTAAGSAHASFTGVGIQNGAAINVASLDTEDRFTSIPAGATVLMEDAANNPITFTGSLGAGSYWITDNELVEIGTGDNFQLAYNAVMFVNFSPVAAVPGLNKIGFLLLILSLAGFAVYRLRNIY